MAEPIGKITIVGGGTTGWLAALFFVTRFADEVRSQAMRVELIESDRVPIVGVGESLSPSMAVTLESLNVDETAFIRETDASFKVAGYFVNWEKPRGSEVESWINPFVAFTGAGLEFERFEIDRPEGPSDYGRLLSPCRDAIERRLGPKRIGQPSYQSVLRYAYHTDATKFAPFMRTVAMERGAHQIIDDVQGAELDERGHIAALKLERMGDHKVELVIDATGFSGVLLNRVLGVPMVDYGRQLINDRAVVAPTRHAAGTSDIEPATRSTALSSGWSFQVPLYARRGNGYIYSSRHIGDDDARREFVEFVGGDLTEEQCRVIPMRVGRAERSWAGNCVALGLAAGFVEPLESSAIYTVETSLKWLFHYFPGRGFDAALAQRYNDRVTAMYDEVVDYIVMHYVLSDRDDSSYWLTQRHEVEISDRLRHNLDVWKHSLPVRGDFPAVTYFDENTYAAALLGKGFYRGGALHPERRLSSANWERTKRSVAATHAEALSRLPSHKKLIESIRDS